MSDLRTIYDKENGRVLYQKKQEGRFAPFATLFGNYTIDPSEITIDDLLDFIYKKGQSLGYTQKKFWQRLIVFLE